MDTAEIARRDQLLAALAERRLRAHERGVINAANLPQGVPSFVYCMHCGVVTDMITKDDFTFIRPSIVCADCRELTNLGWHDMRIPFFHSVNPVLDPMDVPEDRFLIDWRKYGAAEPTGS